MEASSLPDLNCTPPEDLDGGVIPAEGEAAAHQDVNALLAQDDADGGVIPEEGNSTEDGDAGNFAAFEGGNAPSQDEGVNSIAAAHRPRYDELGNLTFSGKIGVWPFVKEVPTARRSQNRGRGTLETKSMIVNREVMREYLVDKVIPAIKDMWPQEDAGKTIYIQQDNARTHVRPDDPKFHEAVAATGLDIQLMQQPANSPDMNVLDLGFFNSIQSLTDCESPETIEDLIHNVETEFEEYEEANLNRAFLSLQMCMKEVTKIGGGNGYKNPHMNKQGLEREGRLPHRLACENGLYASALAQLAQFG